MSEPKLFVKIISEDNAFELSPEGIGGDLEIILVTSMDGVRSFKLGDRCSLTVRFREENKQDVG